MIAQTTVKILVGIQKIKTKLYETLNNNKEN